MAFKVKDILDVSAAALNDQGLTNFTYAVQLPYFKMAYHDLKLELEDNNIPVTTEVSASFTITTAMKDIGGPTGPLLPENFIEPMECWERIAGTTSDFIKMTRRDALPKTDILTAYLEVWTWARGYIKLLGATGSIEVKIDYVCDPFADIVDQNSLILINYKNADHFLGFSTAAYCAEFIGENPERASALKTLAVEEMDVLLGINIKNQQTRGVRRRPFRGGWKRRGIV
jgi:hypothetical protein